MTPPVVLLGPQRHCPTVRTTLDELGADGPLAVISAGWEEREGEIDELEEHVRRPVRDLAFSRDGRHLYVYGETKQDDGRGERRTFDVNSGEEVRRMDHGAGNNLDLSGTGCADAAGSDAVACFVPTNSCTTSFSYAPAGNGDDLAISVVVDTGGSATCQSTPGSCAASGAAVSPASATTGNVSLLL